MERLKQRARKAGVILFLCMCMVPFTLQGKQNTSENGLKPKVLYPKRMAKIPPLRELAQKQTTPERFESRLKFHEPRFMPKTIKNLNRVQLEEDPVVQAPLPTPNIPGATMTFDEQSQVDNEAIGAGVRPSDTNHDVGINYIVHMQNLTTSVYDKTGARVLGPVANNTFWSSLSTDCATYNDGDPVVLYDHLAQRWVVTQFVYGTGSAPFEICVAVSQTGDPTGSWYAYEFEWPNGKFPDYPKYGLWPDGYYVTANQFSGSSWGGQGIAVLERDKMLKGDVARMIYWDLASVDTNFGGALPGDLDGPPPPPGTPNVMIEVDDATWIPPSDALRIWEIIVDWDTPSNSVIGEPANPGQPNYVINTAPFTPLSCVGVTRACVPQPGVTTSSYLDAIGDRLMYPLAYRNINGEGYLAVTHTVNANPGGDEYAGVRWYQIFIHDDANAGPDNVTCDTACTTPPCICNQGTYGGDGMWRWMGSAQMDAKGNLVVGYNVSCNSSTASCGGTDLYPSLEWAGRLATDTANTLGQGSAILYAGLGSQEWTGNRWGDYTSMMVDPSDDCTFWYSAEYYKTSGSRGCASVSDTACFSTRGTKQDLGAGTCTTIGRGTLQGTVTDASTSSPIAGAKIYVNGFVTYTDASGNYSITQLYEGTYDATASSPGYQSQTATVTITNGAVTTQNFSLTPIAVASYNSSTFTDSCALGGGGGNNVIDPGEKIDLNVVLDNVGLVDLVNGTGVLSSVDVTVTDPDGAWPTIPAGGSASTTDPFQFVVPDTVTCGSSLNFDLKVTHSTGTDYLSFQLDVGSTSTILAEDFEAGLPASWTVVNDGTCVETWTWYDSATYPCSPRPTLNGAHYMIVDSDCAGSTCGVMDESLITPSIDLSTCTRAALAFTHDLNVYPFGNVENFDVDVTTDGGTTWTNVFHRDQTTGDESGTIQVDLSSFVGNSNVQIRFRYWNADWDYWWAIDDVMVTCTVCTTCAGTPVLSAADVTVTDANGNGVIDEGEGADLDFTWQNTGNADAIGVTGSLATTSPININDGSADYGDILSGSSSACSSTGNCYLITATGPRPSSHWDAIATETMSTGETHDWVLHIGDSFNDVPQTHGAYKYVETIYHYNITVGCTTSDYCPTNTTTRGQMAVFIGKSLVLLGALTAPACDPNTNPSPFSDVSETNPICPYTTALYNAGIVVGYPDGTYRPTLEVTRGQMAVYIANSMVYAGIVPALDTCTTPPFNDVPVTHPACDHILTIFNNGVVVGCGNGNYCPTSPVTRGQMAIYISKGFQLQLYTP